MKKNEVGNIVGTLEESGNVNSLMMDASNSSMLSRLAPIEQKKFKKLKANHEHKVRKKKQNSFKSCILYLYLISFRM